MDCPAQYVAKSVDLLGIGFMLDNTYHRATRRVGEVRSAIKIPTAFNILAPMLNPAKAPYMVVGVHRKNLVR